MRFPYQQRPSGNGPGDQAPYLPFRVSIGSRALDLVGLVDTGASFSVLPYDIGLQLGFSWNTVASHVFQIVGAAGTAPAKIVRLETSIGSFQPTIMAYAWVLTDSFPIVLGQVQFFLEFDVFLCRRHSYLDIQPATP